MLIQTHGEERSAAQCQAAPCKASCTKCEGTGIGCAAWIAILMLLYGLSQVQEDVRQLTTAVMALGTPIEETERR